MKEYSKYGIEESVVEKVYDLAIQAKVPQEIIYPGIKMILNNALGIDNTDVIQEVGEGFVEYAVNDTREANPTVTDGVIAKNIKEEIADNFNWETITSDREITDAIKKATEKFIENNK